MSNWNDINEPPYWMLEHIKIDYKIKHIGDGEFELKGDIDEDLFEPMNLKAIIRYTYFPDYTLPKVGWKITKKELFKDYVDKFKIDAADGKIKQKN